MSVSVRAKRLWEKLRDWYGTSLIDQYGDMPPSDWCEMIDGADNETVKAALAEIRSKHLTFPPRFPEVDSIFSKLERPSGGDVGPSMQDRLADYVLRNYQLTPNQLRLPWTYIGETFDAPGLDGKVRRNHGVNITGVVIPADGDAPGYRVMVVDMQSEAA